MVTHPPQLFYASLYKSLQLSRLEAVGTDYPMQFHCSVGNSSLPQGIEKAGAMRRFEFANTPVQLIRLEAGLPRSSENVYALQKALTRRAKSTIPAPDWAATIAFSLASTIAQSIRAAGKPAMEFSDFSRHCSFQSTVLPMLMNNLDPAILRRSARRNFQVMGARLTCVYLPSHGKEGNWRWVSKRRSA